MRCEHDIARYHCSDKNDRHRRKRYYFRFFRFMLPCFRFIHYAPSVTVIVNVLLCCGVFAVTVTVPAFKPLTE